MIDIKEDEFIKLASFVKSSYGVNLFEKKLLIQGRLQKILTQRNFNSFSEYYNYLIKDKTGKAAGELLNKVTTNYTFFMREPQHFEFFKNTVLPYLIKSDKVNNNMRIWSAGCSSGEEAYTLAMIISDYLGMNKVSWDTKILATDISADVLNIATQGIYDNEKIQNISNSWKRLYFKKYNKDRSSIMDSIKKEVIFRRFNLMNEAFPFKKKFHVIFCRNVMIYFDNKTKEKLINKFYDWTEPGGYLFIGHSESISFSNNKYKYIMPSVYRKE
ncbi:MAG: protein-glutamate O-methyltransferase CheR [Clostridiaceae bacterium]